MDNAEEQSETLNNMSVDSLIATMEAQAKIIANLRQALYDVAFVARTKISMKQMARQALGMQ